MWRRRRRRRNRRHGDGEREDLVVLFLGLLQDGINTFNFTKILQEGNQVQQLAIVHVVKPGRDGHLQKIEKKKV